MDQQRPFVDMGDRGDGFQLTQAGNSHWQTTRDMIRDRLREQERSREQARERARERSLEWERIRPPDEQSGRLAAAAKNAIPAVLRLVKELHVCT